MSAVIWQTDLDLSPAELEELGFTHDCTDLAPPAGQADDADEFEEALGGSRCADTPRADGRRRDDDEEEEEDTGESDDFTEADDDEVDDEEDDEDDDLDDDDDDDFDDVDDEGFDEE